MIHNFFQQLDNYNPSVDNQFNITQEPTEHEFLQHIQIPCLQSMNHLKQLLLSNTQDSDPSLHDDIDSITAESLWKKRYGKIKIQRFLIQFLHRKKLHNIDLNWSPRDVNRLDSFSEEGAIAFTTIPILPEHRIEIGFDVLICLRLGIDFIGLPTGDCLCGETLTQTHHIMETCVKLVMMLLKKN